MLKATAAFWGRRYSVLCWVLCRSLSRWLAAVAAVLGEGRRGRVCGQVLFDGLVPGLSGGLGLGGGYGAQVYAVLLGVDA